MNSEFKGYGRAESLLERHIPRYDKNLTPNMIQEARTLEYQIEDVIIATEPKSFTIKDLHGETAYWNLSFTRPVIQYVPECFSAITSNVMYHSLHAQHLEHVPSYIPNINHTTLFVNYNHNSPQFSDNTSGLFKIYKHEKHKPMEFLSLNILQPQHSTPHLPDEETQKTIKRSFEYCYWKFPTRSFQDDSYIHNLLYATTNKVLWVLSLTKTLVKVAKIDSRGDSIHLVGREQSAKHAKIMRLCDEGSKLFAENCNAFLLKEVADDMEEGDIINAVMVTDYRRKIPIVIGKIGNVLRPDELDQVVSIVLAKTLQSISHGSGPMRASSHSDLESRISQFLRTNYRMFDDVFWWDKNLPEKVSKSMDRLFPLFLEIDGDIHQLSTAIMTFLATSSEITTLGNRDLLGTIVRFFDAMGIGSNLNETGVRRKLRNSYEYEDLQKAIPTIANDLLCASPNLVNRIVCSRILSQHRDCWN